MYKMSFFFLGDFGVCNLEIRHVTVVKLKVLCEKFYTRHTFGLFVVPGNIKKIVN